MSKFLEPAGSGAGRIGTWIKLGAIESIEIMAFAGFEFVVIDMEHTALGLPDVYQHIVAASSHGHRAIGTGFPITAHRRSSVYSIWELTASSFRTWTTPPGRVRRVLHAVPAGRSARFR